LIIFYYEYIITPFRCNVKSDFNELDLTFNKKCDILYLMINIKPVTLIQVTKKLERATILFSSTPTAVQLLVSRGSHLQDMKKVSRGSHLRDRKSGSLT